jgi:hypothetical protein
VPTGVDIRTLIVLIESRQVCSLTFLAVNSAQRSGWRMPVVVRQRISAESWRARKWHDGPSRMMTTDRTEGGLPGVRGSVCQSQPRDFSVPGGQLRSKADERLNALYVATRTRAALADSAGDNRYTNQPPTVGWPEHETGVAAEAVTAGGATGKDRDN